MVLTPISPFVTKTPIRKMTLWYVSVWHARKRILDSEESRNMCLLPRKAVTSSGAELPAAIKVAPATS